MLLKSFQEFVVPALTAKHTTAQTLQKAIQDYSQTEAIYDADGVTPVELEVKTVKGTGTEGDKLVVSRKQAAGPDPLASEMKTFMAASFKAMTDEFKSSLDIKIQDRSGAHQKNGGYNQGMGEFLQDVAHRSICMKEGGHFESPRLKALWDAQAVMGAAEYGGVDAKGLPVRTKGPTEFGNVTNQSQGGALIPQEFSYKLYQLSFDQDEVLKRLDRSLKIAGNNIKIPIDVSTPWGGSGVQFRYVGEGNQLTPDRPALDDQLLSLHKGAVFVPVTNELLNDSPIAVDSYVAHRAGLAIRYGVTNAVLNGPGGNRPLGLLKSGALLEVPRKTGGTITTEDLMSMYTHVWPAYRSSFVWLVNPLVEGTLMSLPNIAGGTAFSIYHPPEGNQQFGTILGHLVIPVVSEGLATLGATGDIVAACLDQYLFVEKTTGIEAASSIHVYFDYDMTAFRFIHRHDGRPWQSQYITLPSPDFSGVEGSAGLTEGYMSSFVALET